MSAAGTLRPLLYLLSACLVLPVAALALVFEAVARVALALWQLAAERHRP